MLDTDGVNAFAAPGGFVHITRGALGLIKTEAELAGVLGHEIAHVAQKHTVNAIQKEQGRPARHQRDAVEPRRVPRSSSRTARTSMVLENSFDRGDELDADKEGIILVQKAGYAGHGLAEFLARLAERNKDRPRRTACLRRIPKRRNGSTR